MKVVSSFALAGKLICYVSADNIETLEVELRELARKELQVFPVIVFIGKDNSHFLLTTD